LQSNNLKSNSVKSNSLKSNSNQYPQSNSNKYPQFNSNKYPQFNTKYSTSKQSRQQGGDIVCNKGEIMRNGYKTKTGKTIDASCIIARSATGKKTSDELNKFVQARETNQQLARKKFSKDVPKKCPPGHILREGYKRDSYKSHSKSGDVIKVKESWTKPVCIKSQTGKSEKGPKLIVMMESNVLGKYGYSDVKSLSIKERKLALKKAIREIKPLAVYRRLVALATLNKDKDRELSKILQDDSVWLKTQTEYIIGKASGSKLGSKLGSKTGSKTGSKLESKSGSKLESKTKTNSGSKTRSTQVKSSSKSKTQSQSQSKTQNQSKSQNQKAGSIKSMIQVNRSGSKSGSKPIAKSGSKSGSKNKLFYYK
jgi:hypothetical protein